MTEPNLKSEGEKKVWKFLNELGIDVRYEQPFMIQDSHNYWRIFYPDFYLPDFGILIEYYGVENNENYDKIRDDKKEAYSNTGMACIPLHGLKENWQDYILKMIKTISKRRFLAYEKILNGEEGVKTLSKKLRDLG
jgi:hypothetical protein